MAEFVKKLKNAKKSIDPKKSKQTQTWYMEFFL